MATRAGSEERYGRVAIAFHWVIAVLVIANLALGLLHEQVGPSLRREMIGLHKSIGITVLVLSVLRLGWRLMNPPPPLPPSVSAWERAVSRLVQWLFYVLLIALPVTGWWMAAGPDAHPFQWFGLFTVPRFPIAGGADGAHSAHVVMGWTMLALVLLHIAGALRHRLVLGDGVVRRMWPAIAAR